MVWRPMTAEEMVIRPEARLEGSLLLIALCAAALCVAAALLLLAAFAALVLSGGRMLGAFDRGLSGPAGLSALYMIPMLYLAAWSVIFTIMTMLRSPSTPGVAAGGMVGWVGVRLLIGVAAQVVLASRYPGSGVLLQSLAPMLLGLLGEVILATGFWVYMRDGERPNGYYRRLVRAG